jgi:hypothetical protein
MTSAITPRYPNAASDPRLINVNDERKKLREIVTEKEWQGKSERRKMSDTNIVSRVTRRTILLPCILVSGDFVNE